MADSSTLRGSVEQHKPKNVHSKVDDKEIYLAMEDCIEYLNERLGDEINKKGCKLMFNHGITYKEMMLLISGENVRKEFDTVFESRSIKPDGGLIVLEYQDGKRKVILVSEVKKQGTNKEREAEGKSRQSQGNAIERLGKNLIGIRAMMKHDAITPFVCFGWGCDFTEKHQDDFVMAKISMMNEFYKLNEIHVFKKDGNSNVNRFEPVSMFFREKRWTRKEMFEKLKEIGETALRYYLF